MTSVSEKEDKFISGWTKCKLPEFCYLEMGQSPPSNTYNSNGIGLPFYQGKSEFGSLYPTPEKYCSAPNKIAKKGDILLSVRAPVGPTNMSPHEACIGRGLAAIRPLDSVQPKFVLFLFRNLEKQIEGKGTGTTLKAITKDFLTNLELKVPPLAEQHRIVDKIEELFSDLDDGIASLKKAQQQLKVYRQAVLKWAFEGKLTAQWREEQKRQGKLESADTLLEQIKAEREQRYQAAIDQWQADVKAWEANGKVGKKPGKPSKLGEIVSPEEAIKQSLIDLPKNWFWVGVDSLCSKVVDCLHSTPKFKGEGFYCVDTTCIEPGKIVFQKIRFVDEDTFLDRIKRLEPQAGDILFAREGTVGTALLVPKNISLCLGQRMMMFRTLNSIDPSFFMYALQSPIFINQYKPYIGGTTSPHLNISDIKSFFLPVVQLDEQNQIVEEIESRLSICDRLDATITENLDRAEALRQSILKQAFEGKLVPQDPNDEPASVLLERIRQEQAKGKGGIPNG